MLSVDNGTYMFWLRYEVTGASVLYPSVHCLLLTTDLNLTVAVLFISLH